MKFLSNFSQFQCEPEEILTNITEDLPPGTVIKMGYQKLRKSLRFYLTGSESDLFGVDNNGTVIVRKVLSSHISNQVCFLVFFNVMNRYIISYTFLKLHGLTDLRFVCNRNFRNNSDLTSKFSGRTVSSSRNSD